MQTLTKISVEEYLAQEAKAETKSEYHAGEIIAMAGASRKHNVIVNNLLFLINRCLWDKKCQVYPSDMLLKLEKCNKYLYPDLMIVCEDEELEEHDGLDALVNPKVIIEVLSASTSSYDQTEKMKCYLELESLEEYIMVDSETVNISSYTKNEEDWTFRIIKKLSEKVKILDCEIDLEDIYRNVSFEATS